MLTQPLLPSFTKIPKSLFKVPKGFIIKKGLNGYGLFAEKDIKPAETLYERDSVFLPVIEKDRIIEFSVPSLSEKMIHTVKIHGFLTNKGWKYCGADCCINHSCSPNIFSIAISETKYKTIALRPIKKGEEIVCDYNLLILDPIDQFAVCNCESSNCLGKIYGFNNLPLAAQTMLKPFMEIFQVFDFK